MTDEFIHPTPEFVEGDIEVREYQGAFGQLERVAIERFYWVHLDWYEEHEFMESDGGLPSLIEELDRKRGKDTLEDCIRVYVDHYMIPQAIRSGIPPFDEMPENERIEMTREAEVFR